MAGRNQRENADWFSHDADASNDEKIIYLESKFGHTGYAVYFKLLECMARAPGFKLQWDGIKKSVYASKFGISVTEIEQIVTECCRQEIKAFVLKDGELFSDGFIKRMAPLLTKREYNRQKYNEQKQTNIKPVTVNAISVTEMTHSIVKDSIEKNIYTPLKNFLISKIQNGFTPHTEKIIEFFDYRMKKPKKDRYQTVKGIEGLFREMAACKKLGYPLTECLDITMERGWLTPCPDYFKSIPSIINPTQNQQTPKSQYKAL